MFELSGVNYEAVLEQGDSILVRVIGGSSYRGFELSGVRVIGGSSYRGFELSGVRVIGIILYCTVVSILSTTGVVIYSIEYYYSVVM